jgi:hypothetical protein
MTKEQMLQIKIGDIIYHQPTKQIYKAQSCWGRDKKLEDLKDSDFFWWSGGYPHKEITVCVSQLEDFHCVTNELLLENTDARVAYLEWRFDSLLKNLTTQTIL